MIRQFRAIRAMMLALGVSACGVSQQHEIQLGQEESVRVQQELPMLRDPAVDQYITSLGLQLARTTSRADLPWQFFVVNTPVVNAFALPGGIIYVNRGLIERAGRMDELAGVLAHEVEHVVRRHSVQQMERVQGANVGVTLACVLTNVCGNAAAATAINVGGTAMLARFSRAQENEADEGGFQMMIRAGVNPTGMLTFFQQLAADEQRGGNRNLSTWFDTHPGTQDRIVNIERLLAQVPPAQLQTLTSDTPGFQAMRQRLLSLPRPRTTASGR